jgi:hypothetical protein
MPPPDAPSIRGPVASYAGQRNGAIARSIEADDRQLGRCETVGLCRRLLHQDECTICRTGYACRGDVRDYRFDEVDTLSYSTFEHVCCTTGGSANGLSGRRIFPLPSSAPLQ